MKLLIPLFCAAVLLYGMLASRLPADTFGTGLNSFEIEFVPIGDPGNPADTTGFPNPAGSVPYFYRMGKFEISEQMIEKANALGGLGIMKDTRSPDKPATSVDWIEAARFVNWLNESTGRTPAYKFDDNGEFQLWQPGDAGYNSRNLFRNSLAKYVLPSVDEWYKAAYYDPVAGIYYDYPTASNTPPTAVASGNDPGTAVYRQDLATGPADIMNAGGLSRYGTMGQGGNVAEWEETEFDLMNDGTLSLRGGRGGFWDVLTSGLSVTSRSGGFPNIGHLGVGFRVASIPEPSTAMLMGFISLFAMSRRARLSRGI